MKSAEIVNELMKMKGHTYESLAKKLGYTTVDKKGNTKGRANMISERLRGKQEMRVDTLVKMLEAMDCKLVVQSNLADKSKWEIDINKED